MIAGKTGWRIFLIVFLVSCWSAAMAAPAGTVQGEGVVMWLGWLVGLAGLAGVVLVACRAGKKRREAIRRHLQLQQALGRAVGIFYFHCDRRGNLAGPWEYPDFWPFRHGVPQPIASWAVPEDRDSVRALWERLASGATEPASLVFQAELAGRRRSFKLQIQPAAASGEWDGFWGCLLEITEQNAAVAAEREARLMLQDILEQLPGYVFVKEAEGDFRYRLVNGNYHSAFDPADSSCLGLTDDDLFGGAAAEFHRQDLAMIGSGLDYDGIETLPASNGREMHIKVLKKLLVRPDGRRMILGIGIDVTHERLLERELAEKVCQLDAHIRDERSVNRCLEMIAGSDDIDASIAFFLRELGEKSAADRCSIFLLNEAADTFRNTHEWIREGLPSLKSQLQDLRKEEYGNLRALLETQSEILIEDTAKPPAGVEKLAERARSFGIRSLLIGGMSWQARLVGFAVLDFIRGDHQFAEADFTRVRNACNLYLLAWERERRLKEIADRASLHRQIFDNVAMPVMLFDLDHNIIAVNPSTCESTGLTEDELIGRKCYRMLCGFEEPPQWCPMRRTVAENTAVQIEFEGHGHQYTVVTQPVVDRDGNLIFVLEIAHDISIQKEQARQLATQNLLLSRVADLARITYFVGAPAAEIKIIGGNREIGLAGDPGQWRPLDGWLTAGDRRAFGELWRKLIAGEQDVLEMICRSEATGERRSYRLVIMRERYDAGICIGMLQDVSDNVALEEERQNLIRSLNNYVVNERIINACLSQIVLEEDFDRNVDEILRIIATQLDSDRAYFGVFEELGRTYRFNHEWLNEGVSSLRTIRDSRFYQQFLKWYDRFLNDELLTIPDIRNSEYAEVLREPGCKTLMCVPVWVGKKLYGILGVGFIRARRDISDLDLSIMRSAARITALAKEHQLQREALEALDRQNRIILNTMPVPVCLFDNQGRLIRSNPAAAALSQQTPEEMLSRPCYESLCGVPARPEYCPVRNVLESGEPQTHEIDTYGHECLVTATPIRDRNGKITHVLESAIDMTEINEGKRQLEIAMRAAQAADRAKSFFLATMSHELRTPLNAVIGFSELLKSSNWEEGEREEALEAIHEAGNALLELINDILDLSKLEAEKMDIVPEFLNMKEFLDGIGKIFTLSAKSKNLQFRLTIQPDMPQLLKFDRKRLRQVLVNILGNAFKFTQAGGVEFVAEFQVAGEGRGDLKLTIRDTGPGMAPEAVRELFIPFKQHHVRDIEGTGLGLVISQRLAEKMGGEIEVASEPGKGSAFTICLKAMEFQQISSDRAGTLSTEQAALHGSGRALLVDDVAMNLRILGAMLKRLGVDCIFAESGAEALRILETERPGIILTDLWMPGMSGSELVRRLAADAEWKQIPVVAVTADVQISAEERKLFTDLLLKPITLVSLREMLERAWKPVQP